MIAFLNFLKTHTQLTRINSLLHIQRINPGAVHPRCSCWRRRGMRRRWLLIHHILRGWFFPNTTGGRRRRRKTRTHYGRKTESETPQLPFYERFHLWGLCGVLRFGSRPKLDFEVILGLFELRTEQNREQKERGGGMEEGERKRVNGIGLLGSKVRCCRYSFCDIIMHLQLWVPQNYHLSLFIKLNFDFI